MTRTAAAARTSAGARTTAGVARSTAKSTYLSMVGSAGNYASSPDSATLDIASDLTIDMYLAIDDWTPPADITLMAKVASSVDRSYRVDLLTTPAGVIRFIYSNDGSTSLNRTSSTAPGFVDGTAHWLRVSFDADSGSSQNSVRFYKSEDGATWTQIGTTVVTAGILTIFNSISPLEIGSLFLGTIREWSGKFYRLKIYNSDLQTAAGTPVYDANFMGRTAEATSFNESSSNAALVTINQSGSPATVLVGRPAA